MEKVLTLAKDRTLLIERYKHGIKWLNANWDKPNYDKGLRRLEEIEDGLKALGVSDDELQEFTRKASNEYAAQLSEEAQKLLYEEAL